MALPERDQPKVVAVTGATGFVGRHLIPSLLSAGYIVRALVRSPAKLPKSWADNPDFSHVQGNLNSDLSGFMAGVECVIHLAGLIKAKTRQEFFDINADGAAYVAKAAKSAGVTKFILLSSMAAREAHLSHYAASKRAGEDTALSAFGKPISIIRAPAVFGPGDEATKPIFDLIAKGKLPVAGGSYENKNISMIYIDDLVRFITQSIDRDITNRPIEPATIIEMSWRDFAKLCSVALGRPVKIMAIPNMIIKPVAALTSVTSRLFGAGHLTLAKLREFQHPDWTSRDLVDNPTPMIEALRETAASYRK